MKISNKILSIPPYISTNWNQVSALRMLGSMLIISLSDGSSVEIPNLEPETISQIFNLHSTILEERNDARLPQALLKTEQRLDIPFKLAISSIDEFGSSVFQHNANQAEIPEIPQEILQKIIEVTRIVAPDGLSLLPQAEKGCNCVHCQISRTLGKEEIAVEVEKGKIEEIVSENELHFQQWEIKPVSEQLYTVSNKLDSNEKYNVFLGEPVGCTCGKVGCEHLIAVLKS